MTSKPIRFGGIIFSMCCVAILSLAIPLHAQSCCDPNLCADCAASGGLCRPATCGCFFNTPIIVDVSNSGYQLTSVSGGVKFQFSSNGSLSQMAWTSAVGSNAFLALDRNGNGLIDNGTELFGNLTPQPESPDPNGFLALAEFDKPENGGNGDGMIDAQDAVFGSLLLWIDANHDGISQSNELFSLPSLGVRSISSDYQFSKRKDEFGNVFRYRARIAFDKDRGDAWVYDVILLSAN